MKKNLYALIVGINHFKSNDISNLSACVKDAQRIHNYLEAIAKDRNINYHPQQLTNEIATRSNIISGFTHHLRQATEQDIALFFFAGHGSQEKADDIFHDTEYDTYLETIVCHDSQCDEVTDLADKELRYLIHKVAQQNPQIICIFDCCHSGSNTRKKQTMRRLSTSSSKRKWSQFIFSEQYPTKAAFQKAGGVAAALPQGNHIQLAACKDTESASENSEGGIFTTALLKILQRFNNRISYYALRNRIRYCINQRTFPQTPQISAKGNNEAAIFQAFLGDTPLEVEKQGNIIYREERRCWLMDLGGIHGIPPANRQQPYEIEVFDIHHKFVAKAITKQVFFGYSEIAFLNPALNRKSNKHYFGKVNNIQTIETAFFLKGTVEQVNGVQQYFQNNTFKSSTHFVKTEMDADYVIHCTSNHYVISLPFDTKPLVAPIAITQKAALMILRFFCQHIAEWEFVKQIHNSKTRLLDPIAIEFFQMRQHKKIPLPPKNNTITLQYDYPIQNNQPTGTLLITLTNTSNYPYHIALLGLTQEFMVFTRLLGTQMVELPPKTTISKKIKLTFHSYIKKYNWPDATTYFKVLVSPTDGDISFLALNPLPFPDTQVTSYRKFEKRIRFLRDWTTRLVEVSVKNPYYVMNR